MQKIDKLYSVFSPMPSFNSWKGDLTTVFWYRADKVRDGFKYGEIIEGYNDMTPEDKRLYRRWTPLSEQPESRVKLWACLLRTRLQAASANG